MRSGDMWADARGVWAPAPAARLVLRTEPRGRASSPSRQASGQGLCPHTAGPRSSQLVENGVRPGWTGSRGPAFPSRQPARRWHNSILFPPGLQGTHG